MDLGEFPFGPTLHHDGTFLESRSQGIRGVGSGAVRLTRSLQSAPPSQKS
jgi:hypothetical protein